MMASEMAALHARCFHMPRAWKESEFDALILSPFVFVISADHGFALGRAVVAEAELLTIAVDPDHQRQNVGKSLLLDFIAQSAARGARRAFLEVAATNTPAIALYKSNGFDQSGLRPSYYRRAGYDPVDALIFSRAILLP